MKHSEFDIDLENSMLLGLVREYQSERDNDKKGVILEKVLSCFDGYIRTQKCLLDVEEFKQFIRVSFWEFDYLGKYDFVSKSIVGYVMSHIYYCRLRVYNADRKVRDKPNQGAISIYGYGRAGDENERALIDILHDPNEHHETDVVNGAEENRRMELLRICMPRFGKSGQKIIRAIMNNPEYDQNDLAEHCECSYERTRQILSKLGRMVKYYEKNQR